MDDRSAPPIRRATPLLAAVLALALLAAGLGAAPARADLRPGSWHALTTGKRLALPLPTVTRAPTLVSTPRGGITVTAKVRYRAANWHGGKRVRRDRATVWLYVAQRLLTTGPDPAGPAFRTVRTGTLKRRDTTLTYTVKLPARVAAKLRRSGVFSRNAVRRDAARRLVWIDAEQDRDYKRVDGVYDWREGRAANGAEAPVSRRAKRFTGRAVAHAAIADTNCSTNTPCGTLTVQNQTSAGVYCPGCTIMDEQGLPGSMPATANTSGVPLVVGASAMQCFESGNGNSNPLGFANLDPGSSYPNAYAAGPVSTVPDVSAQQPISGGMSVTQPIQANDSAQWADNEQVADTSGLVQGVLGEAMALVPWTLGKLGLTEGFSPTFAGMTLKAMGESSLDLPSIGAIVSAGLDIAEYIIDNSCDGNPNLMLLAAAEPGGGIVASAVSVDKEGFGLYSPAAPNVTAGDPDSVVNGAQLNPSQSTYLGSPLYLNQEMAGDGVQGNVTGSGNVNFVNLLWTNYSQCQQEGNLAFGSEPQPGTWDCSETPASTPVVASPVNDQDCQTGNTACPFPAANFPAGAQTVLETDTFAYAAPSTPPTTTVIDTPNCASGATQVTGGQAIPSGQSVTSPNGLYALTMQPSGTLTVGYNAPSGAVSTVWSQAGGSAGAYAAMQTGGDFVVLDPQASTAAFSTGTAGTGATYLAVQNDGNVIVASASGTLLWQTGTGSGTCTNPSPVTTTSATGCATLMAAGQTLYEGQGISSPGNSDPTAGFPWTLLVNDQGILEVDPDAVWSTAEPLFTSAPGWANGGYAGQGAYAAMQADGNFVLYTAQGTPWFASGTAGNPGAYVAIQNDANVVVYSAQDVALWAASFGGNDYLQAPACPAP